MTSRHTTGVLVTLAALVSLPSCNLWFDVEPFESTADINAISYGFAPNAFAVRSFLYFEIQNDRYAYLDRVMTYDLGSANHTLGNLN